MEFRREVMSLKVTSAPYFETVTLDPSKMADAQISEVQSERERVNMGP
jgi:hypothetical protein